MVEGRGTSSVSEKRRTSFGAGAERPKREGKTCVKWALQV